MSALLIFGGFGENPLVLDTVVHQIQQRVHQNFRDERETADEDMQVIQQRHAKVGQRNGDDAQQGVFERRFARVLLELEDEIAVQDEIQRRRHQPHRGQISPAVKYSCCTIKKIKIWKQTKPPVL